MKRMLIGTINAYKKFVSPFLPKSCRYYPTCSDYAREAIEKFGVLKGITMSAGRVLRCHPFARGGYDPVEHPKGTP